MLVAGVPLIKLLLSPWILIIVLISIVAIGTILDRIIYFSRLKLKVPDFLSQIKEYIRKVELRKAAELCDSISHPISLFSKDVIEAARLPRAQIFSAIERAEAKEMKAVASHVGVLTVCSFVAPLLGLFGTVVGIVQAFAVLAVAGGGTPTEMMAGIAIALLTTAFGIAVAVPAAIAFGIFGGRVDTMQRTMRMVSKSIVRVMSEKNLIDTSIAQKVRKKIESVEKYDPSEGSEALIPGINVAMLVICFFMIFVPNMYQTNFTVSTPALSKADVKDEKEKSELKLNIYLAADGSVYINNQLMPADTGVQNELMHQLMLRSLKRICIISAAEELYHYRVVDMMDRATQCGAEKVCLLKRRKE